MNDAIPANSEHFVKSRPPVHRYAIHAVIVILSLSLSAHALDPSRTLTQTIHRIWQTQQGLPQGTIYCVYQTRDRHLWLGTKTGLVRFDGVQFTVIRDVGGLS